MRWLTFAIIAVIALTLQSTAAPRLELCGARPDGLVVVVVFFALHGRMPEAAVGAWIIGACADLMTIERAGLISFSYALTALGVANVREYLFRYQGRTQFTVTLVACLTVRAGWLLYRRALYDPGPSIWADAAADVLLASVYTAALAPPLHRLLLKMSGALGLARPRYTYAGLHRLSEDHV